MPAAWALAMSERYAEVGPLLDRIEAQPTLNVSQKFEASLIRSTIAGFSDSADDLTKELTIWPEPPGAARPQDIPVYWISRGLASLHAGQPDQARTGWLRFDEFRAFSRADADVAWICGVRSGPQPFVGREMHHCGAGPAPCPGPRRKSAWGDGTSLPVCSLRCWRGRDGKREIMMSLPLCLRCGSISWSVRAWPDALLSAFLTLARISEHEGRHDKAMSLLEELRALGVTRGMPRLHFAAQCEMVRQHGRAGRSETAGALARQLEATFTAHQSSFPRVFVPWLQLQLEIAKVHAGLAQLGADHIAEVIEEVTRAAVLAADLRLGWETIELHLLRQRRARASRRSERRRGASRRD